MTKTQPQDTQTTEPCQAQEYVGTGTEDEIEVRFCSARPIGRDLDGKLYCDEHLRMMGWIRRMLAEEDIP